MNDSEFRADMKQIISDGMNQSVAHGFEMAKLRMQQYLHERAEWLRKEAHNGGDFKYLIDKAGDCTYIASVVAEMKMDQAELHQPSCSICRRDHGPEIVHESE